MEYCAPEEDSTYCCACIFELESPGEAQCSQVLDRTALCSHGEETARSASVVGISPHGQWVSPVS